MAVNITFDCAKNQYLRTCWEERSTITFHSFCIPDRKRKNSRSISPSSVYEGSSQVRGEEPQSLQRVYSPYAVIQYGHTAAGTHSKGGQQTSVPSFQKWSMKSLNEPSGDWRLLERYFENLINYRCKNFQHGYVV